MKLNPSNTISDKGSNKKRGVVKKQDATHEPECSYVEHFCKTICLNHLVHFSPVTVPVHCGLWNAEKGGTKSVVGCEESGVFSRGCSV